jgi:radical SAM superfamily enzyme YgiQ (UPF0313 family)
MKDSKIKLVFLPLLNTHIMRTQKIYNNYPFPYGLGILTGFLRGNGYNVTLDVLSVKLEKNRKLLSPAVLNLDIFRHEKEIVDHIHGDSSNKKIERFAEQVVRILSCQGYDLIGFSVISYYHFLLALLLSKKIKSLGKIKVVLGGPFISIHGQELLDSFPAVDYLIVGDGQIPLLRLIEHIEKQRPIEDVPNLIYMQDGIIKSNPRESFPVEELYMPDFSDLPFDFFRSKLDDERLLCFPYMTSRGCLSNCNFCKFKAVTPLLECKSYNKVATELLTMKKLYHTDTFYFFDETINHSYKYLDKLCDTFIERKLGIFWRAFARAENLDRNILSKMKEAGCIGLTFGIESGSSRILELMGKGLNIEQASEVLKDSYQAGIKNEISLMVGYPYEKEEDVEETVKFIRKNSEYIDTMKVACFRLEKGIPLYNNPEKFGIQNLRPIFDGPSRGHDKCFAFDEVNGLKWNEKIKQQRYAMRRVLKENYKKIRDKGRCFVVFLPFWLFLWLMNQQNMLYESRIGLLVKRLILHLRRKEFVK